ncbi:acetyl/propionyl/methylcrotonyl-CoA carboxylase subunit alpha [Rickettsiales endosymbiont of Trichoplax sp. H2]|uniref:acetyl/propionyl/methylcrotonyl-CoA carboxylase subunit alpha n=1 Tax=Rickettsiales endosymbiont of Trichoplax sp. H2 TaxID=2021221 RepID=UPI001D52AF86|nr:acetyl/propionyl/methylcrotonyl-CoA carboxylase subunit alpha [Rickettsiales endosymbiont of Trichoplax sp. H2]MSO14358.1 Propionyl-CoA carboxylase alpha chain, mitochondrial [Rickettsiales endosymbiont of Trichoplax sp. H2]
MNKIKKILIANRNEIACRIIKTASKLGIKTVAVYSDADNNALHLKYADEAIYIGKSPATQSYLNIDSILKAIKISGADAVHPGYGFLSENYEFAKLMEKSGTNFIGPSAISIKKMGDKIEAKKLAKSAGVNIIPGYIGAIKSEKHAVKIAKSIGYPIMLKAAAGGGGKGMRVVNSDDEMQQAYRSTKNEAKNNFSDSRTFIEKLIIKPRHIEIQVLADKHGNYVCLGERECSIQRHNQKVIEEAPSSFVTPKIRKKMYAQSVALAKKVKYFSAGTIEYIVDQMGNFYFLEMNTRLQVEHGVTELITGIDIVEQMIRIAEGNKLPFKQKDIKLNGWAMESRIYAEDATCGFLPSTGRIIGYKEPKLSDNVRLDTGVYEGGEVSMFYDAMIAKLCTYSENRVKAIDLMKNSLGEFIIRGVSHNINFLQAILNNEKFIAGNISTNFIQEEYSEGFSGAELNSELSSVILCALVFIFIQNIKRMSHVSGQQRGMFRAIGTRWVAKLDDMSYPVTVRNHNNGLKITFENRKFFITSNWEVGRRLFQCKINDKDYSLQLEKIRDFYDIVFMGSKVRTRLLSPRTAELYKFMKPISKDSKENNLIATITGLIKEIKVKSGDSINKGQSLVILEAMKMENTLISPIDGIVKKICCKAEETVLSGDILIEIEEDKDAK